MYEKRIATEIDTVPAINLSGTKMTAPSTNLKIWNFLYLLLLVNVFCLNGVYGSGRYWISGSARISLSRAGIDSAMMMRIGANYVLNHICKFDLRL